MCIRDRYQRRVHGESNRKTKTKMLFVVRHGERGDDKGEKPLIHGDTHLTSHGVDQARETGRYIRSKVAQYQKERKEESKEPMTAIILTSPWLRCLQTAAGILETIGPAHENAIHLEEALGEYLDWKNYDRIKHRLNLFTKPEEELKKLFDAPLKKSVLTDESLIHSREGRGYPAMYKRINLVFELCAKLLLEKEFPKSQYFVVMVTHGFVLDALLHNVFSHTMRSGIGYCAIIESIDDTDENGNGTRTLHNDGSNDHLKRLATKSCLLYTSPSPRDRQKSRMPSSA
eukprot:TRINITY_DN1092_c0_g4_i5.p1 TRINITY_DN1092_c0_g4~~TRINITY_DN1092_c0_g4_i5.p1  ORF type:complete len:309 (+),score=76.50 TRINITY_DN1092_c0_g4_i5:68-928(+)